MKPTKIKKTSENIIEIDWDNGTKTKYTLQKLRNECPCASCKGETILFKTYAPQQNQNDLPGKYDLKSIIPVGNYAIQLIWNDGHDSGIYSWDYLLSISDNET